MQQKKRIVFIGDSITEWGLEGDREQLGTGYVRLIHDYLTVTNPEKQFEIINRGVGGNRITDLASRWDQDVISLNPDIVSISIGINDVWRQLDQPGGKQVYPEQFAQIYDELLRSVTEKTNATIILMEPTVIEENVYSEGNKKLISYVDVIHSIAENYHSIIVPTHHTFMEYLQANTHYKLTLDGVHMNPAGNMLMAKTWLKATSSLY